MASEEKVFLERGGKRNRGRSYTATEMGVELCCAFSKLRVCATAPDDRDKMFYKSIS